MSTETEAYAAEQQAVEQIRAGREKILGELTSDQREKLNTMTGKKYTFPKPDPSRFMPGMRQRVRAGGEPAARSGSDK